MGITVTLTTWVTGILKTLAGILQKYVVQEIGLACCVEKELIKLQDTLQMILVVLADAEKKQSSDRAVRLWLQRLQDIAYDADDVVDEVSYEAMRQSERGDHWQKKASDFFSVSNHLWFSYEIAKKVRDINHRLDQLKNFLVGFQLQITTPVHTTIVIGESSELRSRRTTSSINESDIFGREEDKKRIIDTLTRVIPSSSSSTSSDSNWEKVSVMSIVGIGGLGKTTLAKLVFKDELVNKHFKPTIWIHVSEYFDVEKLLAKIMGQIMESTAQNKFDTTSDFDLLDRKVREQLSGKRYLLVLDDLWNENGEEWEKLCSPLLVGAQGSKILITTRKKQVAVVVKGEIPSYELEKLQDDKCWSIIEKKAFSSGGAQKTTKMTSIGLEIAKKCSGLPLAAKLFGGLMHSRNKEIDWLSIQTNDIWNTLEGQSGIRPVLKLSYDNLSSELKQCFSYCSMFPKNWEINRVTLVQLWIAEGFLNAGNLGNGRSIEDVADKYFESLVWSSFLDGVQKNLLDDIVTCKMHDLVHDLANDVVGDQELASLKVSELNNTSKLRRLQLSMDVHSSSICLKNLSNAKKLRSLFIPEASNLDPCIFSENNHLRILHVTPSPNIEVLKLPSLSINLKHLRYLRLTSLDLSKVKNDGSISKLYNLETLVLTNIWGVGILLINIQSLQKLSGKWVI